MVKKNMIPYIDLEKMPVAENNDPIDNISEHNLISGIHFSKLEPSTRDNLYLRNRACKKLKLAEKKLYAIYPDYRLVSVYGYRSLEIQQSSFNNIKDKLGLKGRNDIDANEQIHRYIAVPEVSGHPTGGAVDILITDDTEKPLDFGTDIHSMEKASQVFAPDISDIAKENRKLLRSIMLEVGFAPYDGEWWHFSYGDREWAVYYKRKNAIYTQLEEFL